MIKRKILVKIVLGVFLWVQVSSIAIADNSSNTSLIAATTKGSEASYSAANVATLSGEASVVNSSSSGYSFYYHGQSVRQALISLSKTQGIHINFVGNSLKTKLNTSISGRFSVATTDELLDILAKQYGFMWFRYSGGLYITDNTSVSKSIEVAPEDMIMLKTNLQDLGLISQRFGYTELPSENKVVVSGPQAYVNLVLQQIKNLRIAPTMQQFAVYRLKYASATDIQLMFNNQQITIPGIASILQSLVQGGQSGSNNKIINQVTEPIRNQINENLSKLDNSGNNPNKSPTSDAGSANNADNKPGTISAANIQADARLNTIVIRDKTPNLKIYKDLIDLLDVPAPLIQVDVLIVRLDQTKLDQAGINWWGSLGSGYAFGYGAANLQNGLTNNISFNYGQINPGQLLVNNLDTFVSSLQFLEQKDLAQTVSHPSLATTDNLPAVISTNENLYVGGMGQGNNAQNPNTNNNNIYSSWQAQIINGLQITPHVIAMPDGKRAIKLSIVLQDGTIVDQNTTMMPNTMQSTITSQAIIKEGQSILLAGYTKKVKQEIKNQVPYLGSIPLLGWFFKSSTIQDRQVSTLYLVTPRIVWMGDMLTLEKNMKVDGRTVNIEKQYDLTPPKNNQGK